MSAIQRSSSPPHGPFRLDGRTAIVTGAVGRLGPVWCRALLDAGANVAGFELAGAKAGPAWDGLVSSYGPDRLVRIDADVTDRRSIDAAFTESRRRFGPAGVLVNNAGIDTPPGKGPDRHPLTELPIEPARRVLEVNVLGLFQTCQAFAAAAAADRVSPASIINIGSLYASVSPDARFYDHIAAPGEAPFLKPPLYGAGKAAVVNLTKYLAAHLAPAGIRVNTLSPGGVAGGQDPQFLAKFTARVPMGRMAVEADLPGPLVFLASEASSYVTGIELRVDGGFTAW